MLTDVCRHVASLAWVDNIVTTYDVIDRPVQNLQHYLTTISAKNIHLTGY